MITDIIEAKRQASRTMKSTSMASMLGAINKLPECANSDVYQQAFLRFMRPGSIGGFGNVWPRSYDEGSGSKNRATNPDELPRIRRRIGDVGKEVYKLQEELSMVRAEAQRINALYYCIRLRCMVMPTRFSYLVGVQSTSQSLIFQ